MIRGGRMTNEKAIKMLEYIKLVGNGESEYKNDAQAIAIDMAIKALEQEPKTGHWIANAPQYDMLNPQYICSECGNAHTRTTPYCEMCGAKMQEVEE